MPGSASLPGGGISGCCPRRPMSHTGVAGGVYLQAVYLPRVGGAAASGRTGTPTGTEQGPSPRLYVAVPRLCLRSGHLTSGVTYYEHHGRLPAHGIYATLTYHYLDLGAPSSKSVIPSRGPRRKTPSGAGNRLQQDVRTIRVAPLHYVSYIHSPGGRASRLPVARSPPGGSQWMLPTPVHVPYGVTGGAYNSAV